LILTPFLLYYSGVYGFVNFGHRPWWYRGNFCKKAGKNLEKKIVYKRKNLKKRKKPWVGENFYAFFFTQNHLYFIFIFTQKLNFYGKK